MEGVVRTLRDGTATTVVGEGAPLVIVQDSLGVLGGPAVFQRALRDLCTAISAGRAQATRGIAVALETAPSALHRCVDASPVSVLDCHSDPFGWMTEGGTGYAAAGASEIGSSCGGSRADVLRLCTAGSDPALELYCRLAACSGATLATSDRHRAPSSSQLQRQPQQQPQLQQQQRVGVGSSGSSGGIPAGGGSGSGGVCVAIDSLSTLAGYCGAGSGGVGRGEDAVVWLLDQLKQQSRISCVMAGLHEDLHSPEFISAARQLASCVLQLRACTPLEAELAEQQQQQEHTPNAGTARLGGSLEAGFGPGAGEAGFGTGAGEAGFAVGGGAGFGPGAGEGARGLVLGRCRRPHGRMDARHKRKTGRVRVETELYAVEGPGPGDVRCWPPPRAAVTSQILAASVVSKAQAAIAAQAHKGQAQAVHAAQAHEDQAAQAYGGQVQGLRAPPVTAATVPQPEGGGGVVQQFAGGMKLTLSEEERAARSRVVLPYEHRGAADGHGTGDWKDYLPRAAGGQRSAASHAPEALLPRAAGGQRSAASHAPEALFSRPPAAATATAAVGGSSGGNAAAAGGAALGGSSRAVGGGGPGVGVAVATRGGAGGLGQIHYVRDTDSEYDSDEDPDDDLDI